MALNNNKSTLFNKPVNIETYRERKITMLTRDFKVKLKPEEIEKINSLLTEYTIDYYCREILRERLK